MIRHMIVKRGDAKIPLRIKAGISISDNNAGDPGMFINKYNLALS